jgi:acyl-CoA synthetase (AMP-forming)/AMP-acid ligase II
VSHFEQSNSAYQHIRLHGLGDVLREHRRSRPQQTAVVDEQFELNWPQLDSRVNQLANFFITQKLGQGDRILWLGQNSFRLLETLLAAAKIGAMLCPVNWRQSPAEMTAVVDDYAPAIVLWQATDLADLAAEVREKSTHQARWIQHDGDTTEQQSYEALIASVPDTDPDLDIHPDTPVVAMYTAAFDGRPNAALLSQSAFLYQSLMIAYGQTINESSVYLNSGPLFHLGTMLSTMATFCFGGKNVFTARVDAEEMLQLIETQKVTHAFVVQPTLMQIREINAAGKYDTSSLWSAPDAPEWKSPLVMPVDAPFNKEARVYGQTEVMGFVTMGWLGGGGAGRVSPLAQVRILDDEGNERAPNEAGEIAVRGVQVMNGYLDRDAENNRRSRDGWHRTNDLGMRLDDGSIAFVGPKTTMIKSGAENIYPAEVEACLRKHPAVNDVCVIGVPDPKWQQNVKAVVVVDSAQEVTAEVLIEHCREHLASYKKPKLVEFVTQLPRGGDGQINRTQVDKDHGGGGYPATS